MMEPLALRARIRSKLSHGHLPNETLVRAWSEQLRPERCDACDEPVAKTEAVVRCEAGSRTHCLHVECMYVWYLERHASVGWSTASKVDFGAARAGVPAPENGAAADVRSGQQGRSARSPSASLLPAERDKPRSLFDRMRRAVNRFTR